MPFEHGDRLSELHEVAGDLERTDRADGVHVRALVPPELAERFAEFAVSGRERQAHREWSAPNELHAMPSDGGFTFPREVEELQFTRTSDAATLPTRAHDGDAGLDLYAAEGARIGPGQRVTVGTGLAVAIPQGLGGPGARRARAWR